MPLLIPTPSPNPSAQETWMTKLLGKKITDAAASDDLSFAKRDLPNDHRIVEYGDVVAGDGKPERLNVHLGEDGTVRHVDFK
ncbi:hypothetical protein XPA_009002 [Xanthoria parietina]